MTMFILTFIVNSPPQQQQQKEETRQDETKKNERKIGWNEWQQTIQKEPQYLNTPLANHLKFR